MLEYFVDAPRLPAYNLRRYDMNTNYQLKQTADHAMSVRVAAVGLGCGSEVMSETHLTGRTSDWSFVIRKPRNLAPPGCRRT